MHDACLIRFCLVVLFGGLNVVVCGYVRIPTYPHGDVQKGHDRFIMYMGGCDRHVRTL